MTVISQLIAEFARTEGKRTSAEGTLKCYYKPKRKRRRVFTAKTAAQAVCAAMAEGVSAAEMRLAFAECLQCTENRRRAQQQVAAEAALVASNNTFAVADAVLAAMDLAVRIVSRVSRFVPQARVVGLALIPIERQLGVVRVALSQQRAANDAVIRQLRQAA